MSGTVDILLPSPPVPAGVGGAELLRLPLPSHVRYSTDIYFIVGRRIFPHIQETVEVIWSKVVEW
jgi:hypothetical protein